MPVRDALAQEEKLRQRCAVTGLEPNDILVGRHRRVEVSFALEQSRQLVAQRRRLRIARQRRIECRVRPRAHAGIDLELGLETGVTDVGRCEPHGASGSIECLEYARLRLERERQVVPARGVASVSGDRCARSGLGIRSAAQAELGRGEIGVDLGRMGSELRRLPQRISRSLAPARGLEHERKIGPCIGRLGCDLERRAYALRRLGNLARLEQHDAGVVQGRRVTRVGRQHRVVTQEGLAQFPLLVQSIGAVELGSDAHRRCRRRSRANTRHGSLELRGADRASP